MIARKSCAALECGSSYLPCSVILEKVGQFFLIWKTAVFFGKVAYRPPGP